MIKIHVSMVLAVRDGFTGRPVLRNDLRVFVDGQACLPEYREGGYFVFTNLAAGQHEVVLKGNYYLDELLQVELDEKSMEQRVVSLKPSSNYPFGGSITQVMISILKEEEPAAGKCVCMAISTAAEVKIAQELVAAGSLSARLYLRGNVNELRLPANYLIADDKNSEICTISAIEGEVGLFMKPLSHNHPRSKMLYPCQTYTADKNGLLTACFKEPVAIVIFIEDQGYLQSVQLAKGDNHLEIRL